MGKKKNHATKLMMCVLFSLPTHHLFSQPKLLLLTSHS